MHNLYCIECIPLHERVPFAFLKSRRSLKPQILTEKNEEPLFGFAAQTAQLRIYIYCILRKRKLVVHEYTQNNAISTHIKLGRDQYTSKIPFVITKRSLCLLVQMYSFKKNEENMWEIERVGP